MSKKVLIVCKVLPEFLHGLREAGFDVDYRPGLSRENILEEIVPYDGLVIRSKQVVDKALLDRADKLSFVGRVGSGLENVDTALLDERGIRIYRSPEGNADAVAEHALGMLLALLNKLRRGDRMVRNRKWDREAARGVRLAEKTVGLIGYGYTGRAFAKKLSGMNVRVLAHDPFVDDFDAFASSADMEEIMQKADILSYHVPLNESTKYHFNRELIKKMRKPFYLVNTARGPVVNTADLLAGLASGKVLGAALDVFENEDMLRISKKESEEMQRLSDFEDVMLSPHVAGWNDYSKSALHDILLKKIVGGEF